MRPLKLDEEINRDDLDEFARKAFFAMPRARANPVQAQRVMKFILSDICKMGTRPKADWTPEERAFHSGLLYVAYTIQNLANLSLWAETETETKEQESDV